MNWLEDSFPTGQFPYWHFSEDKAPTDTSLTETSLADISPNKTYFQIFAFLAKLRFSINFLFLILYQYILFTHMWFTK